MWMWGRNEGPVFSGQLVGGSSRPTSFKSLVAQASSLPGTGETPVPPGLWVGKAHQFLIAFSVS